MGYLATKKKFTNFKLVLEWRWRYLWIPWIFGDGPPTGSSSIKTFRLVVPFLDPVY